MTAKNNDNDNGDDVVSMSELEIKVILVSIGKDLKYLKEKLDARCAVYDKQMDDIPILRDRISKLEVYVIVMAVLFAIFVWWSRAHIV